MSISSSVFKEIILKELATRAPEAVLVEQLYKVASNELMFDEHDLNFTTLKHEITGDLNW